MNKLNLLVQEFILNPLADVHINLCNLIPSGVE